MLVSLLLIQEYFKDEHAKHGTEARALIYQALDDKEDFVVMYPEQINSVGMTISNIKFTIFVEGKPYKLFMDCHSHHTMGAFWSATDDANEMIPNIIFGVFSWKNLDKWLFRTWNDSTNKFEKETNKWL